MQASTTASPASTRARTGCVSPRVRATAVAHPRIAPPPAGSALEQFVQGRQWAEATIQLQRDVHDLMNEQLGPLAPQPTKHAPDGTLYTEGNMALSLSTHAGGPMWHKYLSTSAVPSFNMVHARTGAYACVEQTTPFFILEMGGSEKSVLLAASFAPRLCLLRHLDYMRKYYRTVPPGTTGLTDFDTIYKRMLGRAQSSMGITTVSDTGAAPELAAPLYKVFTSTQLWTRLHGHAALFSFDPCDPEAWEAARQDVHDIVKLWCAWVKADWEQRGTPAVQPSPQLLDEWRDRSLIVLRDMDHDQDGGAAERLLGPSASKVKETINGAALLAPRPSWLR